MRYGNETINKLLDDGKITEYEYEILFVGNIDNYKMTSIDFVGKDKSIKEKDFNKTFSILLKKIIRLQKQEKTLDLSYIKFHKINFSKLLRETKVDKSIDFTSAQFKEKTSFEDIKFLHNAIFTNVVFEKDVNFNYTSFKKEADFSNILFKGNSYFKHSNFQNTITFENSECRELFDLSDTSFFHLNLDNFISAKANYLRIDGWNNKSYVELEVIASKHIATKETARIIKAHFEKNNNIIESNKFFAIEMDKYRDKLKDYAYNPIMTFFTNQDYFVLTLNKYISNFGTDWIRPLLIIFIFGFFSAFIYALIPIPNDMDSSNILLQSEDVLILTLSGFFFSFLLYLLHIYKEKFFLELIIFIFIMLFLSPELRSVNNDIAKLVNPLNIFKGKDYFEHIAPFGMFVKLIMSVLIYQFIMAFRQNTRRK